MPAWRTGEELAMPPEVTRVIPTPDPFDFDLTVGHQTNYRGKTGSDLLAEGAYYRALWIDDAPVGVVARPTHDGAALEVSLPNGGDPRMLDVAAERIAWLLGFDVSLDGFYEMLATDPVLSGAIGHLRGLRHTRTESVFEALVHAIVGQQVSGVVARVIRDGLVTEYGTEVEVEGHVVHAFPKPATILEAGVDALRALKLSGRKAEYVTGIAQQALDGGITHEILESMGDEEVVEMLSAIRGVGRWTCQWVLMRALGRVDALPAGDLALQRTVGELYFDGRRLTEAELERFAEERWKPYRGLATTYLFAHLRQQRVEREAGSAR